MMKTEHQKLLLKIAYDAIFKMVEENGADGAAPSGRVALRRNRFQGLEKSGEKVPRFGKNQQAATQFLPNLGKIPNELKEERASFVTLTIGGQLRGCIGMLKACRPLAEDVAENAVAAAFRDPRFPPLSRDEFDDLKISISILSPPEEISFSSEADVLHQIRPGIDGLILQEGFQKGTFLPSVWEELPEKKLFWAHLKLKAGLPTDYWSDTLRVFRYTAEYIQE